MTANEKAPVLAALAAKASRDYITPEDVEDAFDGKNGLAIATEVLAVLGGITGLGAEDKSLCAYNAWALLP